MPLIAIDWGSSSFRAYMIDDEGCLIERIENDQGVFTHTDTNFETTLMNACGKWLKDQPQTPIVMAGMIGSRSGWIETNYIKCPVNRDGISRHLTKVPNSLDLNIQIISGVSGLSPSTAPDVMRGEEVQIFGALKLANLEDAIVCLPGTHSKWASVTNRYIKQFSTFFTGEIFALLKEQSSIGAILENDPIDEETFCKGLDYSRQSGGFLHHIFSARAQLLTNSWQKGPLSSYLSGIVVGHEFSGADQLYPGQRNLLVVGNDRLQQLYQLAATTFGYQVTNIDADLAVIEGIRAIAIGSLSQQKENLC